MSENEIKEPTAEAAPIEDPKTETTEEVKADAAASDTTETAAEEAAEATAEAPKEEVKAEPATEEPKAEAAAETPAEPEAPAEPEEISYHAVEKDNEITAIWEMQGRKHIRTISARSSEGQKILSLFTSEIHETDSPAMGNKAAETTEPATTEEATA